MPTLLQFGAGSIGRGFLAPLFAAAGWQVSFVDVDPALLVGLRERGGYRVRLVSGQDEAVQVVTGISVVDGRDIGAVARAVAEADLASTAVGLNVLPRLGAPLAAGIRLRNRPLDILVCENGAQAHNLLRGAITAALAQASVAFGCVRTSIGRMIPAPAPGNDPLDIRVEPYAHLPVERAAFTGPVPEVPGLEAVDDFDLVLRQKLYLHNLTHACLAYGGHRLSLATIPECMEHTDLVARVRGAGMTVAEALGRAHGAAAGESSRALVEDLLLRYRNRALADPVARVARDPWRKLAADDRLIGAVRLCQRQGVDPAPILLGVADALRYAAAPDEPRAEEWNRLSPMARLAAAATCTSEDPIMQQARRALLQAQAAERMRAAGLTLRDEEAAAIEIADFGLDRYEEFGLAIHVYVNTDRCCAKELMMQPGQVCPEHRHPPIGGEPGKEETFRVRRGEVYLYLPGEGDRDRALRHLPADKRATVSVHRLVHLRPGDQCTLAPDTRHWFVAGSAGAVVSEFSTRSRDEVDIFTDPAIRRVP
jgi:mannitol-1-phosphate 5-dehydrogenase